MSKEKEKRDNIPYKSHNYITEEVIIILQRKAHFFNLIWSLEVWLAGLSAPGVVVPSLSFEAPSAGMMVEAKSC